MVKFQVILALTMAVHTKRDHALRGLAGIRACRGLFARLAILLGSVLALTPAQSQEEWDLKTDKDGIRVFTRAAKDSKFNEIRLECTIDASLSAVVAVLLDVSNYYQWVYHTKTSTLLHKVNEQELYFYTQIESPWGTSNRDLAVHLRLLQESTTGIVHCMVKSVPDYVPRKESFVRVPLSNETWTITPLGKASCKILYYLQIDPGGSVPAWLVNQFSSRGPYQSFYNLRKQAGMEKYRKASFPFIAADN